MCTFSSLTWHTEKTRPSMLMLPHPHIYYYPALHITYMDPLLHLATISLVSLLQVVLFNFFWLFGADHHPPSCQACASECKCVCLCVCMCIYLVVFTYLYLRCLLPLWALPSRGWPRQKSVSIFPCFPCAFMSFSITHVQSLKKFTLIHYHLMSKSPQFPTLDPFQLHNLFPVLFVVVAPSAKFRIVARNSL